MTKLSTNNYGKSRVRLVRISRGETMDELKDIAVEILLEGDFTDAYLVGDNSLILPTDTMKNTVYALAAQHEVQSIESFARLLVDHFVDTNPQKINAQVDIRQTIWRRLQLDGQPQPKSFLRAAGGEKRTASVRREGDVVTTHGGLDDLRVFRTGDTAFAQFFDDPYTTLPETNDRVLQTKITANWRYRDAGGNDVDYDTVYAGVRDSLLRSFATHDSKSVQHTLYSMCEDALAQFEDIVDIDLSLPNVHCLAVDLTPFNIPNKGEGKTEVFLSIDEPSGHIWARVERDSEAGR